MHKFSPANYDAFFRNFTLEVPDNFNFAFDVFDDIAASHPERAALVHIDDTGARRDVSFAELARDSRRLANALAVKGLGKGDPVMLILYRRVEFWTSMLALHRLGSVAVPSPSMLTSKDIVYRAERGGIKGVIAEDSVAATVEKAREQGAALDLAIQVGESTLCEGWLDFASLMNAASDERPRPADCPGGEDPLLIFFTSGATGHPKMVKHSHTYPLGHFVTAAYWHDLREGDIHLTLADTGWGKAVWGKMYGQWMAGASVFVYDFRGKFDPGRLLRILSENKVTSFCGPPTVYRFLVRENLNAFDLGSLRHCTTAGELLNTSVFEKWVEATGLPIYEGYGQTETTLQIATFPFMEPKPGSIGKPAPGWSIVLRDMEGATCSPGEEGEICVDLSDSRPIGLFSEYIADPGRTAEAFKNGYYHTGDKGWMDEDGYIWFLGRVDDLIKSSGYRIGPFEVESALVSHPAVVEAAVTGLPDETRGQIVKATVVPAAGYEPGEALIRELQTHVKSMTAPYKYPRVIDFVTELPKTISGKIKRAEIRERDLKART